MKFFGREAQLDDLLGLWGKRVGSLVTCRGRRRIGKSTLIARFAERSKARFVKLEGLRPQPGYTNEDELAAFATQLSAQTGSERTPPADWYSAFIRLDREICDGERTVVLIDEISWFGHYDRTFADYVKIAWDNHWKKHDRLIVVLCGSVSGWIRENIVDNGAFLGRRSLDMIVRELPLADCAKFWGAAAQRIDAREIADVLSVTGGVPRYLEEIDPGTSAAENIRRMAFRANGLLRTDFDEMFTDVVTRQPRLSGKALRALAGAPLSVSELAAALRMERGGKLSSALVELEEAGFVEPDDGKNPATGESARERRYRLKDNYARFYLRYVEPVKAEIDAGAYSFASLAALDGWESVMGLAFENLVVNNWPQLLKPLHLDAAQVVSAAPWRRAGSRKATRKKPGRGGKRKTARGGAREKADRKGVQVDLLLQTRRSLCVVEIKRQREIGRDVIDEVAEKVRRIPRRDGTSVRTALVYEGALAPIVEADGYFDAIVPFRRLLGV